LSSTEKNAHSHRAKAMESLIQQLRETGFLNPS
jgi:inosine/xanthosine triphosphate pyrophosphatase family protein